MTPMLAIPVGIPQAVDFTTQLGLLVAVGLLIAFVVGAVLVLSSALATNGVHEFKSSRVHPSSRKRRQRAVVQTQAA